MKTILRMAGNRVISSLLIGTCLCLLGVADASAHGKGHRAHVVKRQPAVIVTQSFPRWLQNERQFQRWYIGNRYRLQCGQGFQRAYDIYRFEKDNALRDRRFRGRVMLDRSYRIYSPGRKIYYYR